MFIRPRRLLGAGAIALLVVAVSALLIARKGIFASPTAAAPTSEWQQKYWDAANKAQLAAESGDWPTAARQNAEAATLLPDAPNHHFGRALALANLGQADAAFQSLEQAVECGWADVDRLTSEPGFTAIRDTHRFEVLLQRIRQVADERIVLYLPDGMQSRPLPDSRYDSQSSVGHAPGAALLIVFHGRGQNPHDHIRSWKAAADRLRLVVAAPRGVDRFGGPGSDHSFRWDSAGRASTLPACRELVRQSIELAGRGARIDQTRIIVAGYSQGGAVALSLLADMPERFCGAVVQATSYSPRGAEAWKLPPGARVPRVSFILHELYRLRPQGESAHRELMDAGFPVQLDRAADTDHELPADNLDRRVAALQFVLGLSDAPVDSATTGR